MTDLTLRKLDSYKTYSAGWCFSDALPFTDETIEAAKRINRRLIDLGIKDTDCFPGLNGQICVTAYWPGRYWEIEVDKNGKFSEALVEIDDGMPIYMDSMEEAFDDVSKVCSAS